jgi:hypothetical protein
VIEYASIATFNAGIKVNVKQSRYRSMGPRRFWEVKASDSVTSALEGGRLSALRIGHLYPRSILILISRV